MMFVTILLNNCIVVKRRVLVIIRPCTDTQRFPKTFSSVELLEVQTSRVTCDVIFFAFVNIISSSFYCYNLTWVSAERWVEL